MATDRVSGSKVPVFVRTIDKYSSGHSTVEQILTAAD